MENIQLENYCTDQENKNLFTKDIPVKNTDFIQVKKDESLLKYRKLIKLINSDLLFLQNSTDKIDSIQFINDLQKCYSDSVILNQPDIKENLPLNEILLDYLLNELMIKSDFEFLFSLIRLFLTLINVYQDSITSILLQPEFIENILSIFTIPSPLEIRNITLDFIFNIFNLSKNNINISINYFDDLYQIIWCEVQRRENGNDISVISQYLLYLEKIVRFHPQFICAKVQEVSQLINYIFQRQDLNLFFKLLVEVIISIIDLCFEAFCSSLPYIPVLSIVINNLSAEKNLSYQSLYLRYIEKVAIHKLQFERVGQSDVSIFCQVCPLVSLYWKNSTINDIIKLSLKATFALLQNYDETFPLFMNEQIINRIIDISQSDQSFEIKQISAQILFYIIFVNFETVNESNFNDIYEVFEEYSDTNIVKREIVDILQQKFDKCTSNS